MSSTRGWAASGESPIMEKPPKGRRVNLLGAVTLEGPLALMMTEQTVNGETFAGFLEKEVCPVAEPGSILVMDRASIHCVEEVQEVVRKFGMSVLFLPPYSPELSPMEPVWKLIKSPLKALAIRSIAKLKESAWALWEDISPETMRALFRHCYYSVPGLPPPPELPPSFIPLYL